MAGKPSRAVPTLGSQTPTALKLLGCLELLGCAEGQCSRRFSLKAGEVARMPSLPSLGICRLLFISAPRLREVSAVAFRRHLGNQGQVPGRCPPVPCLPQADGKPLNRGRACVKVREATLTGPLRRRRNRAGFDSGLGRLPFGCSHVSFIYVPSFPKLPSARV